MGNGKQMRGLSPVIVECQPGRRSLLPALISHIDLSEPYHRFSFKQCSVHYRGVTSKCQWTQSPALHWKQSLSGQRARESASGAGTLWHRSVVDVFPWRPGMTLTHTGTMRATQHAHSALASRGLADPASTVAAHPWGRGSVRSFPHPLVGSPSTVEPLRASVCESYTANPVVSHPLKLMA